MGTAPPRTVSIKRRSALAAIFAALLVLAALCGTASAASPATTVTLTFDDGLADQYTNALPALTAHGMNGTFYVNSAHVANGSQYLTWAQVQALANAGNEIGGHTLDHPDLTTLDPNEAARQVCNDRVNLISQGFSPTDFAYPFGANNATVQAIVKNCGYNSGRALGGVVSPFDGNCLSGCPYAESLSPSNVYAIKTPDSVLSSTSVTDLENLVTQAQNNGGGWVNVVFHDICDNACSSRSMSSANFSAFLDWLRQQQSGGTVAIKTTQQVIGGSVQPAVPGPPPSGTSVQNASLENLTGGGSIPDCWQAGGYGTNSPTFSRTSDAHSGSWAEQLAVSNFSSGAASLVVTQDQGQCSPAVAAGRAYKLSMWYKATAAVSMVAYYRDGFGAWHSLASSSSFGATGTWTNAVWTTPALPSTATGISFGPMLTSNGSVTVDDLGLTMAPPTVSLTGLTAGKTYSGALTLQVAAGTGTDHVDYLVGGNVVGTATSSPWSISWNSANIPNGATTVTARAVDSAGAFSTSTVNISVDNSGSIVRDSSLEWTSNGGSIPDCWQASGYGTNTFAWSHTTDAHSGGFAERVDITSYTSGGRYLLTSQDPGPCAPAVTPGKVYTLSEWFKSNVSVSFLAYTRDSSGNWTLFKGSPNIAASPSSWTQAVYTLPAIPAGATAISYGLQISSAGYLTVDDAALLCGSSPCDITAPTSSATAPGTSGTNTFAVAYTAADNQGGSGLAKVDLYAKTPGASSYTKVATDTSGNTSGAFTYTAGAGDGSYSFYTVATDKAGNTQATPSAAQTTTLLDTTAPTSSAEASALTGSAFITVSFTAGDTQGGSGLAQVDLYAKAPGDSGYTKVATVTSGSGSGSFTYTAAAGDGTYSFYTLATDKAGNVQGTPSTPQATTVLDTAAPSSSATAPATSSTAAISVAYTASDNQGGSGLAQVALYAKGPGDSGYAKVASDTSGNGTGTFTYTATAGDGGYSFYTVATDNAGNTQATPSAPQATTLLDTAAPTSAAAVSGLSGSASITVSYTAGDNQGGSGLAMVDLYAKARGDSGYTKVATDTSGTASGTFTYTAAAGDGTYSFYTVATDNAGNTQATPSAPQATTQLDTTAPNSTAAASTLTRSAFITVSYTAGDNPGGSGLATVDLYAKAPGDSGYTKIATDTSGSPSGTFTYTATAGDGTYSFYTVATDNAGNTQAAPSTPQATTLLDTTAPTSAASAPASSGQSSITVSYTAGDNPGGSGLATVDLYAKAPGDSGYTKVATDTSGNATGAFTYTAAAGDGTYSFYTVATDNAGNTQAASSTPQATTLLDTTAPSSHASAPATSSSAFVTVTYTASDNPGGSGLATVDLYAKAPGDSGYTKVATDTSGNATGSFTYTAIAGNGTYSFYTLATDATGNVQAAPNTPDASLTVNVPVADSVAPTSSATTLGVSNSATWSVSYTASDNQGGSGLAQVALYAKGPGDSGYANVASDTSGNGTGTFTYTATAGDGGYSFYTVATDNAGNTEAAHAAADASTQLDTTAPTSSASATAISSSATFPVGFTASDGASGTGISQVSLYVKAPGDTAYSLVATNATGATSGTFSYTGAGEGTYSFYTQASDAAGNTERAPASAEASVTVKFPDTTPPTSHAGAPATSNTANWSVSYSAADNQGGSGVAKVDLYAKAPGAGSYAKVATDTSGNPTGSFAYTAAAGDGTYSFYTVATDASGNVEVTHQTADAATQLDTANPTSSATTPASSASTSLTASYTASDNAGGTGLARVDLYVKAPGAPAYTKVASNTGSSGSGSFSYTAAAGDGTYSFYTVATDRAGNVESAPSAPDATTLVDTSAPTAFQMANPGTYLAGNVKFSLSTSPNDSGSGMAAVAYQYRAAGSTGSWATACTATVSPWNCSWNTNGTPDATYNIRAVATDKVGNATTAANAPLTATLENTAPAAKSVSTSNAVNGTKGKAENGDAVTFTYTQAIDPGSILSGWTGSSTPVQVQLSATKSGTSLAVLTSNGKTQLPVASSLALGGTYVPSGVTATFNATMQSSGASITVTLGTLVSGSVSATPVTGGTLTWTPSASATNLAGVKCSTAPVTAAGPAF